MRLRRRRADNDWLPKLPPLPPMNVWAENAQGVIYPCNPDGTLRQLPADGSHGTWTPPEGFEL